MTFDAPMGSHGTLRQQLKVGWREWGVGQRAEGGVDGGREEQKNASGRSELSMCR